MGYKVKTTDDIVVNVIKKMDERSLEGQKKYGLKMMEEVEGQVKDLRRFLVDVQEELMDAFLYLESARACLQQEIEECYINDKFEPVVGNVDPAQLDLVEEAEREARMNIIGQNGNDGLHYEAGFTTYPGDIKITYVTNKEK